MRSASIIVATRDRERELERTLRSVAKLRMPQGMAVELLLVDNASTDGTGDLCRVWQSRVDLPFEVMTLTVPGGGKSAALNRALEHATGELLLFTDDDMDIAPDWLTSYNAHMERCDCVGACGGVDVSFPEGRPPWMTWRAEVLLGASHDLEGRSTVTHLPGLNMAVRREFATKVGDFSLSLGPTGRKTGYSEDVEWSERLGHFGPLCYIPEARATHRIPAGRSGRWFLWKRQLGFARTEWALRGARGEFASPLRELLGEFRRLLGALLRRTGSFEGFDYGLELASRFGRVQALLKLCSGRT